jgi:hypothetical protein
MSYTPPTGLPPKTVFNAHNTSSQTVPAGANNTIIQVHSYNDCSADSGGNGGLSLDRPAFVHGEIRTSAPTDRHLVALKIDNALQSGGWGEQISCNSTVRTEHDDGTYSVCDSGDTFLRYHIATADANSDVGETRLMGFYLYL